jgi:hypothetical protein
VEEGAVTRKRRVVPFPVSEGPISGALARLAAKVGNSEIDGVLVVTTDRESNMTYALHGSMRRHDLAFVGAVFQKWATEGE